MVLPGLRGHVARRDQEIALPSSAIAYGYPQTEARDMTYAYHHVGRAYEHIDTEARTTASKYFHTETPTRTSVWIGPTRSSILKLVLTQAYGLTRLPPSPRQPGPPPSLQAPAPA
eukprot:3536419-Rhodomonas_salina.1